VFVCLVFVLCVLCVWFMCVCDIDCGFRVSV